MDGHLFHNCLIVTGDSCFRGVLATAGERISGIWKEGDPGIEQYRKSHPGTEPMDLGSKVLMAGGIDAHVHFREPGAEYKAGIESESAAALAGGVTTFIDMPNTNPPTVTEEALRDKLERAARESRANYAFHIGATNTNFWEIRELAASGRYPFIGIKVFMGSSTGDMLVDRRKTLEDLFSIKDRVILVHSEDEGTIKANLEAARSRYGDDIPFSMHPEIRSREACVKSTATALELAVKCGTRLHLLHVSTAEEVEMIREAKKEDPLITAETTPNYLWFSDRDYTAMRGRLKCNPAVKTGADREALREAVRSGVIDTIGTDHAPHLASEKDRPYTSCPSGLPSLRECLSVLMTIFDREDDLSLIARIFSENTARIFGIKDRGFLKTGAYADLTVVDPEETWTVNNAYKCGWTPYEGITLKGKVKMTIVNGLPDAAKCVSFQGPRQ